MSRDIAALLDKHTTLPEEVREALPPRVKKPRGSSWKKCATPGCRRHIQSRNETFCAQCRITYVPPAPRVPEVAVDAEEVPGEFARLQGVLREWSAVQPFPEHLMLLEWDSTLLECAL